MKKFNFLTNQLGHESYEGRKRVQAVGVSFASRLRVLGITMLCLLTLGVGNAWGTTYTWDLPWSSTTNTSKADHNSTTGVGLIVNKSDGTPNGGSWTNRAGVGSHFNVASGGCFLISIPISSTTTSFNITAEIYGWKSGNYTAKNCTITYYTSKLSTPAAVCNGATTSSGCYSVNTDITIGNSYKVANTGTLYIKISPAAGNIGFESLSVSAPAGTSVSLTNGGCDGSGGTTKGSFTMSTSSVTTTSSSGSVTLTCTPANGYQTSSVSATDPATHPGSITYGGSGNSRTVTYPTGHNGSSTITVNFTCVTPTFGTNLSTSTVNYTQGDAATALTVGASANSATINYQWQTSPDNSVWTNTGTNSSANTSITPSTASVGTTYYRCIATNAASGCSATETSNVATITVAAASNFTNGETVFIQAGKSGSAWSESACVKAWFNASGAGGAAQTTYWLFDVTAEGDDKGKKLFAAVVPSTGDLNQVTLQRFASNCSDFWNNNGTLTKASCGGSNTFRTEGSGTSDIAWNLSGVTMELHGDPSGDEWASKLADVTDQGSGIWSGTYSNYAPANVAGTSQDFKIKTNYNGWIGNTGSNNNATLSGMKVGSTYNITATLDITNHSLVMSKTFVKGEVSFDLQGHGSAISKLTNVTAGSKISAPSVPTDGSYIFGGWYKEAGCVNAWDFANDVVNESMTLYAKWYQVTLVVKDEAGTTLSGDGKPTLTRSGASLTATEAGNYAFKTIAITSGTGTLSAVSSSTTIATVSSDITVTATFWNARTVTKGTGTGTGTFTISASSVKYNTSVTVTCAAADGYKNPWTLTVTPSDGATYDETGSTGSITISNITKNITVDLAYTDKGCTTHYGTNVVSGSSSTSATYGPVYATYNYGTRQILYTKTDLGLAVGKKGTIKSIYFDYNGGAAMAARTIKIYMANTSLTALSKSNYVPYASFTQVYSGTFSCSSAGWHEIVLNTPYEYNGAGSLVVLIDDNSGSFEYSKYFNYHTASTTTGALLYTNSDTKNEDPATTDWSTYTPDNNRPNTKFCIEEDDMVEATVNWYVNGSKEHTQTDYPGTAFDEIPTPVSGDCDGEKEFVGWYTDDYTHASVAPAFVNPTVIPEGGADYYAVFATVTPTNNYQQITSEGDLVAGAKYLIVGNSSTTYNALPVDAATSLSSVSPSGTPLTISNPGATLIWTLEGSADAWKIKSTSNNKYLQISDGNLTFETSTSLTFSVGVSSNIFTFTSSAASGNKILSYYNKNTCFNAYTGPNNVYVFKQVVTATNYATTCAETYNVTRAGTPAGTVAGGTFTVSPSKQAAGKTVTLSATPDLGYAFGSWTVTKTESPYTDITSTNVAENTLTMPAYGVTVNATFTPTPELTATGGDLSSTTLPFGTSCEQDEGTDKTFVLNGYSLTNNVTLTIGGTDASMFSVKSPSSPIDKGTGRITDQTVTVTFTPTSTGAKTATLTIASSGASSIVLTLSGTAIKHYKVHYWNSGTDVHQESVLAGTDASATWDGVGDNGGCDTETYKYFVGWSKTNVGSTPTTTKPTIGETYTSVSSDVHYYAVWTNVNPGGWERYESSTLAEGDYLIVQKSGETYYTMKNGTVGSTTHRMDHGVAVFSGSLISAPSSALSYDLNDFIWHIAESSTSGYYTIYNADESKYVAATGTASDIAFVASPADDKELFSFTYSSTYKTYNWTSKYNTDNSVNAHLRDANSGWACYAAQSNDSYLYYRAGGTAKYITNCCDKNVTLATNSPANGTITFSPEGPIGTCGADAATRQTTMTVTPDAGYYLSAWSTTGVTPYSVSPAISYGSVSNSGAQATTVTFNQNTTTGTYTANATFSAIPVSSLSLRAQQTGQSDKVGNDLTMNCYPKEGQTGGNDPLNHTLKVLFEEVLPANALDKTYDWSVRVKATGDADWTAVGFTGNALNTNSIIHTFNKSTGTLIIKATEGTAEIKITAHDGSGVTAKVTITVANVALSSLNVAKSSTTLYVGESEEIAVTYDPLNTTTKGYTTGSYTYVTIGRANDKITLTGKTTASEVTETVTLTSSDAGAKTATIDVTVKPLPTVTFLDIVHNKTDFTTDGDDLPASGIIASTASEGVVTHSKKTPTRAADVTDPGVGRNTCEREHLHLIGWIRSDYDKVEDYLNGTGSQLTITQIISAGNDGSGHAYFLAPDVSIDVRDYEGKTFYAVWAKIE